MRPPSLLTRIIRAAADRLAQHPRIPDDAREAFAQHAAVVIEHFICDAIGGERLWAPSKPRSTAAAQADRIVKALIDGEAVKVIARREAVTDRWVRKLRRIMTLQTERLPP